MKSNHKARLEKWQRLCPAPTRLLITLVQDRLVPTLEKNGFSLVDVSLRQTDQPVAGRMIELERWADDWVDSFTFNFDKYRAPRHQVHASRRSVRPPHEFLRSANLVTRASQYLHFWGKPWWLPSILWSPAASLRTVDQLAHHQAELLHFLEIGERSGAVSRAP